MKKNKTREPIYHFFLYSLMCVIVLLFAAFAVTVFWKYELLVTLFLVGLAFVKRVLVPVKQEFVWYIFVGIIGPVFENLIIWGGAWHYPQHTLLFVPLWLPFLWGLAATCAIPIYNGFVKGQVLV